MLKRMISVCRKLRIFDAKTGKVQRRIHKSTYPVDPVSPLYNKKIRLFHDDSTINTFYRRLAYSPDGNLLYVSMENFKFKMKIVNFFLNIFI